MWKMTCDTWNATEWGGEPPLNISCWWFLVLPAVVSKLEVKQKLNISGDLSFLRGTFSTDGHNMTEEDYII